MDRTFDRSEAVPQFIEEAREHLDNVNSMLISLEENFEAAVLDRVLRTAHNLKGEAKMMKFEYLGNLCHNFEEVVRVLAEVQDLELRGRLFGALFEGHDMCSRLVEIIELCGNDEMDGVEALCCKLDAMAKELAPTGGRDSSSKPQAKLVMETPKPAESEPQTPTPHEPQAQAQAAPPKPEAVETDEEDLFEEIDEEIWDTAIDEIGEHCNQLNVNLIQIEKNPDDTEMIKDIFRSMHTIKGTTGILGLTTMNTLSHSMENVLSEVRDGNLKVTSDIMDVFFRGMDFLSQFLESAKARQKVTVGIESILADLDAILQGEAPPVATKPTAPRPPAPKPEPSAEHLADVEKNEETEPIPAPPHPTPAAPRTEPARPESQQQPAAVKSAQRTEALRVNIQKLDNLMNSIESLVMDKITLDEQLGTLQVLSEKITVNKSNLIKLFRKLHDVIENQHEEAMAATQSLDMDELVREEIGEVSQDINQELTYLDISGAGLIELTEGLYQSMNRIGRVSTELQEGIMLARMVPVSTVFGKFRRTVRDLSKQSGKQIQFMVQGEDTELDKRVIEEISDPLMHILRNSIDHGVETPPQRTQAGKDPTGTVFLNAYYESNDVVIEIIDDGKGIDPQKIGAKAVERKLIDEERLGAMTKQDILNLIFTPGFSTAERVTEISGRGVGMDVVATNIANLNGRVELDSTAGKGTKIKIKIPLTLAIIQALMVTANEMAFAVPLSAVVETIKITPGQIETVEGREVVSVREKTIPVIRLEDILDLPPAPEKTSDSEYEGYDDGVPIVIVAAEDGLYGLMVADLLGKREIVIKSLGYPLERLPHIMGATLLGDGSVIPILDIPDIVATAIRRSANRRRKTTRRQESNGKAETSVFTQPEAEHRRAASVLVVDDSQSFAMMLKRMLDDSGFAADWAQDGFEGIQFLERGAYNLAIIDMEMPRMSGLELLEKLRANEKFAALPVIIATTRGEKSDINRAIDAGANAYLVKPFDKKTLFNTMSKLMAM